MLDGWGMSAEDYEVEQDLYLRGLSKRKEGELLEALQCLNRRIHRQRRIMLAILSASILGLIATVFVALMVYGQ